MEKEPRNIVREDRERITITKLPGGTYTFAIDGTPNPPNESIGETTETQTGFATPGEAFTEGLRVFDSMKSFVKAFGW
tara:strand:- start:314 stop:547 length:234 start_codon:yes stop_codon:yes gene_type:complete